MVATISPLSSANMAYYTKSYYLDGQAEGEWLDTKAARFFHLAGEGVRPKPFERLLLGFDPRTNESLVQNAGKENRQIGWDLQFAVDKSFSVLAAVLPEIRAAMEQCLVKAVEGTIREVLEPEFLETRRGQGGRIRESVTAPVASFIHRTNRENEIHLHCHAVVPNVGIREDGTKGTIVSWNLYDANHALGKAFHARFAEAVRERLGVECEFDEHGLSHVRGFPKELSDALSTPSRKIAEAAEDESARAKEEANLKVRAAKTAVPFEEVEERCREKALELGFTPDDARKFLGTAAQATLGIEAARAALGEALEGLPAEFSKADFLESAFREGAKAGVAVEAMRRAADELLHGGEELRSLGRVSGQERYAKVQESPSERAFLEDEFRAQLKDIIEKTPDLLLAEFVPTGELLPPSESPQENLETRDALKSSERDRITAEDVRATLETLGVALSLQGHVLDDLAELVNAKLYATAAAEHETFNTLSLDTDSPALTEFAGERNRAEALERNWVDEAAHELKLPANDARSVLERALQGARSKHQERLVEGAVDRALAVLTGKEAHFTREELTAAVEELLPRAAVPYTVRDAVLDRAFRDPARITPLGTLGERESYTTPELFRAEEEGLRAAKGLQERHGHAEERERAERRILGEKTLTAEEREAALKAVTGSDLVIVMDPNGLSMHAVQRGIFKALEGRDVLWVAPTAAAAGELKRNLGEENRSALMQGIKNLGELPENIGHHATQLLRAAAGLSTREVDATNVTTLQKLIHNLDRGVAETMKHHGTMLVHAAFGLPTFEARQLKLTSNTTVVLDSASLVDTRQLSSLLQHAQRAGARVIACGTHDLPSLGPGGFFKELRHRTKPEELVSLSEGPGTRAEFIPTTDREQAKKLLIDRWAEVAMKRPQDHTIVAAQGHDVHDLNEMAQGKRRGAGRLGFRSAVIRYDLNGRTVKERIFEGDRVVFTARTGQEVINGVFGTVKHIDLITGRMKVALDLKEKRIFPWEFERQKTIEFQYRKYRFFQRQEEGIRLGYAATIYRTQTKAVEGNSYCLSSGPEFGAPSAVYALLGLAKGQTFFFGPRGPEEPRTRLKEKLSAHAVRRRADEEETEKKRTRQRPTMGQGMSMGL